MASKTETRQERGKEGVKGGFIDYSPFVIEEGQAELIKQSDRDAMTKYFTENEKFLRGWAYNFLYLGKLHRNSFLYDPDDLVNQVFVDMPYYDFTDKKALFVSVIRSFIGVPFGGYRFSNRRDISVSSLDDFIAGSSRTGEKIEGNRYSDFAVSMDLSPLEVIEHEEHCNSVLLSVFNQLQSVLSSRSSEKSLKELRDLVEYIFPNYTYSEVCDYVRRVGSI